VLFAAFVPCATATITAAAQAGGKPLFTDRPWLRVNSGFVAVVPLDLPWLVVIRVGKNGIEAPPNDPNDR
jgi:hypothetical protein